jgi:hypothetical protein
MNMHVAQLLVLKKLNMLKGRVIQRGANRIAPVVNGLAFLNTFGFKK